MELDTFEEAIMCLQAILHQWVPKSWQLSEAKFPREKNRVPSVALGPTTDLRNCILKIMDPRI